MNSPESHQESSIEETGGQIRDVPGKKSVITGNHGPWRGPFRQRIIFLVLLIVVCSFVGGFFGGHYGETRNVTPYPGPRAIGTQVITAGERVACLWGAVPVMLLGCVLGSLALCLRVRMDVAPVGFGACVGGLVGFFAGFIGGVTHAWLHATVTGLVIGTLVGFLGYCAAD